MGTHSWSVLQTDWWLSWPCSEGTSVSLQHGTPPGTPSASLQHGTPPGTPSADAAGLAGVPLAGNPVLAGGQPQGITTGHCWGSRHGWLRGTACVQGGASQDLQAPDCPKDLKSPETPAGAAAGCREEAADLAGLGCCQECSRISQPQHGWSTSVEWDPSVRSAGGLCSSKPHGSRAPARLVLRDLRGRSSSFLIPFLANLSSLGNWEASGTWLEAFLSTERTSLHGVSVSASLKVVTGGPQSFRVG